MLIPKKIIQVLESVPARAASPLTQVSGNLLLSASLMWKLEYRQIRTVVIQAGLYITVNGTQASELQKYCLEILLSLWINQYTVKEEIRSQVMVARHSSYAALVQRQPGKEDKKITSAVNPILAMLTGLGSVILIEESLSINVVFRSKHQWIMTEYIKSSLAFNRGFEHWAWSSKLRIIPSWSTTFSKTFFCCFPF